MSTILRRLIEDAPPDERHRATNRLFDVLNGNEPGRIVIYDDDGVEANPIGGATVSSGNFAAQFRSGVNNHVQVRNAADSADLITITEAGGGRITADLSHATLANRLLFAAAGTNQTASVGAVPSGTATTAGWAAYNNAAPASATGAAVLRATNTAVEVRADNPSGAGALPLDFYANATKYLSVTTAGALNFPTTAQRITADLSNATIANRLMMQSSTANGVSRFGVLPNGSGAEGELQVFSTSTPTASARGSLLATATEVRLESTHAGASYLPLTFRTNNAEQMRIDEAGDIQVGGSTSNLSLGNDPGNQIGFFGDAGATQTDVSGTRTGTLAQLQTVVANLLSALDGYGLITDSTS